jgi:TetR/AcrR family transcriptional regulator
MSAGADRLSAEERRAQIIAAAAIVFGERGYAGGTTDAIAQQAGISQAYVVRMFGSKEHLFTAVCETGLHSIVGAFRGAIERFPEDATPLERESLLGQAYTDLIEDRGLLLSLLQLFSLGHDPVFGDHARSCFLETYRVVRDEAGLGPERTAVFFSRGMLITVLMAMRTPVAAADPDAAQLLAAVLGSAEPQFLEFMLHPPLPDARR